VRFIRTNPSFPPRGRDKSRLSARYIVRISRRTNAEQDCAMIARVSRPLLITGLMKQRITREPHSLHENKRKSEHQERYGSKTRNREAHREHFEESARDMKDIAGRRHQRTRSAIWTYLDPNLHISRALRPPLRVLARFALFTLTTGSDEELAGLSRSSGLTGIEQAELRDSKYREASMHTVNHQFRTWARNAFVTRGRSGIIRVVVVVEAPDFTRPLPRRSLPLVILILPQYSRLIRLETCRRMDGRYYCRESYCIDRLNVTQEGRPT